jgi:hypothetical protein
MRSLILIFLFFLGFGALSQIRKQLQEKAVSQDSTIKKWIKAVVNLEVRNFYDVHASTQAYLNRLSDSLMHKLITPQRLYRVYDSLQEDYGSSTGTSIFLKYKSRRYLITARHILYIGNDEIHRMIYFVPQQKELFANPYLRTPGLMNLEPGQYIFSSKEDDLAIISLNIELQNMRFADFLEQNGYSPIELKDIDSVCDLKYGQDLICIGFPFLTHYANRANSSDWWNESKFIFQPAATFGKISAVFKHENNFIGDINVVPGNSGGPIISNNKLIGIVSAQPRILAEDKTGNKISNIYYRVLYAIAIKSSFIFPLFKNLVEQENYIMKAYPAVSHRE